MSFSIPSQLQGKRSPSKRKKIGMDWRILLTSILVLVKSTVTLEGMPNDFVEPNEDDFNREYVDMISLTPFDPSPEAAKQEECRRLKSVKFLPAGLTEDQLCKHIIRFFYWQMEQLSHVSEKLLTAQRKRIVNAHNKGHFINLPEIYTLCICSLPALDSTFDDLPNCMVCAWGLIKQSLDSRCRNELEIKELLQKVRNVYLKLHEWFLSHGPLHIMRVTQRNRMTATLNDAEKQELANLVALISSYVDSDPVLKAHREKCKTFQYSYGELK